MNVAKIALRRLRGKTATFGNEKAGGSGEIRVPVYASFVLK